MHGHLDKCKKVMDTLLALKKALNSVGHVLLTTKLEHWNISGIPL